MNNIAITSSKLLLPKIGGKMYTVNGKKIYKIYEVGLFQVAECLDLTNEDLSAVDLSHSYLDFTNFTDCDLSNTDFTGSSMHNCTFVRTTFNGTVLDYCEINGSTFEDCNLDLASTIGLLS